MRDMLLEGILVAFAAILWYMGWNWERTLKRPRLGKNLPLVSFLIPAFKSEDHIAETIQSVQALDYPKKEILVVNDSDDQTPRICKSLGVYCLQNKSRKGKAHALNTLVRKAGGDILFFLDSDSAVKPDCLKRIVPWFSRKKIAAVSPRWMVKNKKSSLMTRLINIENRFNHSFFKTHMFLGSMISFRGCGVAIRRGIFEKLGGWPNTLIEDADLSARILRSGHTIQYEPEAIVQTNEPETARSLFRQRFRWGKGSIFSVLNHRGMYKKNVQFILYFLPYVLVALAIAGFVVFQTGVFMIPFISFYLIYTFSLKETLILLALFFVPLLSNIVTSVVAATLSHVAIMSCPETEGENSDILLIVPYVGYFLPLIFYSYLRGVISGFKDRRNRRGELNLKDW